MNFIDPAYRCTEFERVTHKGKAMSRICPWWLGYVLASPLRKLLHDPYKVLRPYLTEGMVAVDIGSGMGYFSIPMARLVGNKGRVICVDLQEKMLSSLKKRAIKAGVLDRIEIQKAESNSLKLESRAGNADFVLAFAVIHEVPDQARLFSEIWAVLKPGGKLLVSEPRGHVTAERFVATEAVAQAHGFVIAAVPEVRRTHSAVLIKK
jgi:ubiquinone/menaquinone biosynthesis C-methylase UbiE